MNDELFDQEKVANPDAAKAPKQKKQSTITPLKLLGGIFAAALIIGNIPGTHHTTSATQAAPSAHVRAA